LEAVAIGGMVTGKVEDEKELARILKKLGWKEYIHSENEDFSVDFHHLDELLAGVTSNHLSANEDGWTHQLNEETLQTHRDNKRLSSPWHWRLYFALDTPSHAVTDNEWQALILAAEKSEADLSKALAAVLEF